VPCVGRELIYADALPHNRGVRITNVTTSTDRVTHVGYVTLRYWASARAAAGTDSDALEVAGPVPLADLVARARQAHVDSARFSDVIACCSIMVDDRPVTTDDPATVLVQPGATIEFLPPFAGG
jgi:molybdopterin synthase sulfur carrier subunit